MRLWSLHPSLLDRQGLVALWREGLLAQAVLAGRSTGYTRHPQLHRFRESPDPLGALAHYLDAVATEASARGYSFNTDRIDPVARHRDAITVTSGQLDFELAHLRTKLQTRSPDRAALLPADQAAPHPSFRVVAGDIASWERP